MKTTRLLLSIFLCFAAVACGEKQNPLDVEPKEKEEEKKEEEPKTHDTPTDPAAIYGYVKDTFGAPVSGAVVSDGYACCKSGSDGYYCFITPRPYRSRFAFVSIPSGYEPLTDSGLPKFYTELRKFSNVPRKADITIRKMNRSQDEFYFIFTADPQARAITKSWREKVAFASLDAYEDMFDDQQELVSGLGGKPCYGIALGDICFNDPTAYTPYIAGMKRIGIPFYGTIGNHDHQASNKKDDDACASEYEDVFGPRNFSVNIGKIHVISLDDMYFEPDAATGLCVGNTYIAAIEDDFLNWIKEDLKYVPKTTPIFICVHCPLIGQNGLGKSIPGVTKLASIIEGYKVYFWAGHVHGNRCFTYDASSTDARYECHTLFRSTGCLYLNEYVNGDGVPRGYVVMHVDGNKITWKYKPTAYQKGGYRSFVPAFKWRDWHYEGGKAVMNDGSGTLDSRYQIKAYSRGDYDDDFIYANVFMWDNSWKVPTVTIDGKTSPMTQTQIYDQTYKEVVMTFFRTDSRFGVDEDEPEYASKHRYHHFKYRVPDDAKGKATVSVTDRFGDKYSYEVSADPKVYTDGNLHLKFDFDVNKAKLPTSATKNVSFKYNVDGTDYSFLLSNGYFNETNCYTAISKTGSSLKLPAISGYRLVGITIRTSNNTAEPHAKISSDAAGSNVVTGGEDMLFCGDCSDSWTLTGTAFGTSYYVYNASSGFPIAELRLTYSKN